MWVVASNVSLLLHFHIYDSDEEILREDRLGDSGSREHRYCGIQPVLPGLDLPGASTQKMCHRLRLRLGVVPPYQRDCKTGNIVDVDWGKTLWTRSST